MNYREIFTQTVGSIRAHKLRSFLTMFGIIWGITSVILLVGLGIGFRIDQTKRMETLGKDLVIVWGGRTSSQAGGLAAGRPVRLSINDVHLLQQNAYLIKRVSPELDNTVPQVSPWNSAARTVHGIWPEYQVFRSLRLSEGRLFKQEDESNANRVVILGSKSRDQLYPGQPAIGQTLLMRGLPYTVVGVLQKKKQNSNYDGPDNDMIFVPYSAIARDFPPQESPTNPGVTTGWINNLVFEVANPADHEEAIKQLRHVLGEAHHFNDDDKDALFVWDTMRGAKMLSRIFSVMTIFFGIVAVITLLLGGIGVMNIMLVAVSERTREIGTRKAIGATRQDILRQFFAESAALTIISGTIGFIMGTGICLLMGAIPMPDFVPHPVISPTAVIASLLTLSLITICAGMYPAYRAAEMQPVDCLRYE